MTKVSALQLKKEREEEEEDEETKKNWGKTAVSGQVSWVPSHFSLF